MKARLLLLSSVAIALAGCGGAGLSGNLFSNTAAGTYTGSFANTAGNDTGVINLVVNADGSSTGNYHDNLTDTGGSLTGSFDSTGGYSGTYQPGLGAAQSISGAFTINATNTGLIGTLTINGATVNVTLTKTQ